MYLLVTLFSLQFSPSLRGAITLAGRNLGFGPARQTIKVAAKSGQKDIEIEKLPSPATKTSLRKLRKVRGSPMYCFKIVHDAILCAFLHDGVSHETAFNTGTVSSLSHGAFVSGKLGVSSA
jgi:hypothetical protein